MLSILFAIFAGFSASADEVTMQTNIYVSCPCVVYNNDMLPLVGSNHPISERYVRGEQKNVSPQEAAMCEENLLGEVSDSCVRAYNRVIGSCQELAGRYTGTSGIGHFEVDKSSCVQEVVEEPSK